MSNSDQHADFFHWYKNKKDQFREYSEYILKSISTLLPDYKVSSAIESAREKDVESLKTKCKKLIKNDVGEYINKYPNPKEQITDLAGVRIVTYTTSDVPIVCNIIKRLYTIDEENSNDKRNDLKSDKVGYLSVHYIVSLKSSDPQYEKYKYMKCEIQVRSLLQHAWAQIFHDRQYKPLGGVQFPQDLLRKTNLVAGSLELLDNEIDVLVKRYDEYYRVPDNSEYQKLLDENISETTLKKFLYIQLGHKYRYYDHSKVLEILSHYKLTKIRDFEHIYNSKIALEIKDMPAIMIDHIVLYMIIAKFQNTFFKEFGDTFTYTQRMRDILDKYSGE